MFKSTGLIICTIIAYLLLMILIGYYYSKKNSNSTDFFLGGRKLGPFVTAMSAEASDMSSYLLMGLPGLAYISGLGEVGWTAIGLALGTYLNWLLVAKPLRRYSEKIGAITIPDFFSKRFHDDKNIISTIAAIVIIIFFVPYTASGFAACGKLFNSLFGVNYYAAMIVSAAIIVIYTTLGGFLAASFTDLIQSIFMTVAICLILLFAINEAGGISQVIANAKAIPGYLSLTATSSGGISKTYSFLDIVSTLAWGLGYFGMPHILLRFMAIEDENKLKISRRVGSIWVLIAMSIAIMIGFAGSALSNIGLIESLSGSASETVIIKIANFMSSKGAIFAIVAGIVVSGILASTMSTADSQLLAASSSISQNIVQDLFKKKLSEKQSLRIARITVISISIVALFIANNPNSSIFGIVSFAWAGFGACFGPVVILALYDKKATLQGSIAGMIAGGIGVVVWEFVLTPLGGIFAIYELLPAFLLALIINLVVSKITYKPNKGIEEEFNSVNFKKSH